MAITITGLTAIDGAQVQDADLIVLEDITEGTTKKITFGDLTDTLLSTDSFTDNIVEFLPAINNYNAGAGHNTLNATNLFYNGAYRNGQYYLTYDNFLNTPTIPFDLNMLVNSTGFIRLDSSVTPTVLIYEDNVVDGSPEEVNSQTTKVVISTKNVPENTQQNDDGSLVGPLYYTEDRVEAFLDANFSDYYNQFSSTFDDGNVRDSLFDVSGTFTDVNLNAADTQGSVIRVTDTDVFDNFSTGQTIRIYGADTQNGLLTSTQSSLSVQTEGFAASSTVSGHTTTFEYKVCEYDIATGQIAPPGNNRPVTFSTPDVYFDSDANDYSISDVYQAFNTDAFVRLSFQGVPAGKGLLIYRKTPLTNEAWVLTAVLGTKEVNEGQWVDYYNFDWVEWSGRLEADNTYPTSVIHFPHTVPSVSKRGWVDTTITQKNLVSGNMELTIQDAVFISSDSQDVTIAHNDTQKIRTAITQNKSIDKKSIVLNAKTYVSAALTLPDNFGITGTPYITKIVKLPWSGGDSGISSAKMVKAQAGSGATNISIVGVDFDGNALNQFMFPDNTDDSRNYCIDLGISTDGPLVDKVRIRNVIGGGVYADRPVDMRFVSSEVLNSGVHDRDSYSPLFAYGGEKTTISANRFENFGGSVDVTNTDKGIVSDNMLNNVGSGVTVYGSKFFISSQNVLIGPANEFLPTPDTLNSEFDLINIDLNAKYLAEDDYLSDPYVYQENGEVYDLTQTDGTISELTFETHYVEKLPNGGEQFWTPNFAKPIEITPDNSLTNSRGEFGFSIPFIPTDATKAGVKDIKHRSGSNSYTSLTQNTIIWDHVAEDLETYTNGGTLDADITAFIEDNVVGYNRGDVTRNGSITTADKNAILHYSNGPGDADYEALSDEIIFRIQKFWENTLLDDYARTSPTLASDVLQRYVNPGNANHKGIVWIAKYKNETSVGTPNVASGADMDEGYYYVTVTNIKRGAVVGSKVKLNGHGSAADGLIGTVTRLTTTENTNNNTTLTSMTIKFVDAQGNDVDLTGGQGNDGVGDINIIDTFVLAQGRIL